MNILQGERELASDCRSLGKFKLTGITSDITVEPMHGLTDSEVEDMLTQGYTNAQADFDNRSSVELITEMGIMLQAINKNLAAATPSLDKETLDDLQTTTIAAQTAITQGPAAANKDSLQKTRDALEQASLPLAAVPMDSVVKQAASGKDLADL